MEIIINGSAGFQCVTPPSTLQDVLVQVLDYLAEHHQAMIKLKVNGQEVYPGKPLEAIQQMDAKNIYSLEITATPTHQLVKECLEDLERYTPELGDLCVEIAKVFQGERPEEGLIPFQKLTQIWSEIKAREAMIINALGRYMKEDDPILQSIHEHIDELNTVLREAYEFLEKGDFIGIGDILEYELAPQAHQEPQIVAKLKEIFDSMDFQHN